MKPGRLPTRVVLDKIGVDVDSLLCPRCGRELETVDHALVSCVVVKKLWGLIGRWWKVDVDSANSWEELCECGKSGDANNIRSRRWLAMVWCSLYIVWSNRNKVVFEKANREIADFFFDLQLKTYEWMSRKDNTFAIDWATWLMDPGEAGDARGRMRS